MVYSRVYRRQFCKKSQRYSTLRIAPQSAKCEFAVYNFHGEKTEDGKLLFWTGNVNDEWGWVAASKLSAGESKLLSNCKGDLCRVKNRTPSKRDYFWLTHVLELQDRVFNLATDTYTFYVGPEKGRVLAHNVWP